MTAEWEAVAQGALAFLCAVGTAWAIKHGKKQSTGDPPEDRPPAPNEVKAAIAELRERVDRNAAVLGGEFEALNDKVDRLEKLIDRIDDRMERDSHISGLLARIAKARD